MKVLLPLATGFEEIEAVTIIDVLRRADLDVITTYLHEPTVSGAHKIKLIADANIDEINALDFGLLVLPGGMPGSENLASDPRVVNMVRQMHDSGKFVAAICAGPIVLGKAGILDGKRATCYPGFEARLGGAMIEARPIVVDSKVVTGNGPGNAMAFALKLVELVAGEKRSQQLQKDMLVA